MIEKKMKYLLIPFLLLSSSCELLKSAGIEPQTFSLNGVKLIRPDITEGDDARTMLQSQYFISNSSRLLLRFEEFLSKVDTISLGSGHKVNVFITVDGSTDVNQAKTDLVLCPILKNWMMHATWNRAHPFSASGAWNSPGGDYSSSECITATTNAGDTLQFDITSWVINYAIGRNQNYGLLLIPNSASTFGILGDSDGAKSPRIEWTKI